MGVRSSSERADFAMALLLEVHEGHDIARHNEYSDVKDIINGFD